MEGNQFFFSPVASFGIQDLVTSFPKESFMCLYVLEENKHPVLSLVFLSFTKSKTMKYNSVCLLACKLVETLYKSLIIYVNIESECAFHSCVPNTNVSKIYELFIPLF